LKGVSLASRTISHPSDGAGNAKATKSIEKTTKVDAETTKDKTSKKQKSILTKTVPAATISAIPETQSKESGADSDVSEHEPEIIEPEPETPEVASKSPPLSSALIAGRPKESGISAKEVSNFLLNNFSDFKFTVFKFLLVLLAVLGLLIQ
jgi:hypothetical protein